MTSCPNLPGSGVLSPRPDSCIHKTGFGVFLAFPIFLRFPAASLIQGCAPSLSGSRTL